MTAGQLFRVPAWLVCEGDIGPGGHSVALVYREVVGAKVRIVWSDGNAQSAEAESLVTLTARPTVAGSCPGPRPGRVAAALLWLLRERAEHQL